MTRIDFYILDTGAVQDRYLLSCRIAEKAWKENHRVMIQAASEQEARHLDQLLWTFRDQSFVPHGLLPVADTTTTPVIIGWNADAGEERDILITLGDFCSLFVAGRVATKERRSRELPGNCRCEFTPVKFLLHEKVLEREVERVLVFRHQPVIFLSCKG